MAEKRQEYEIAVRQCLEVVKGIMTRAKNDGLSIGVKMDLDVNGEPQAQVVVVMR